MIFYDWKKIYKAAKGDSFKCFIIFKMYVNKEWPICKFDRLYKYINTNFHGLSFLINPEDLLYYAYKYTNDEIAEYLKLAALRSWAVYKTSGTTTLDLLHADLTQLTTSNRLLHIKDDKIHFLYEEVPKEK